MKTVEQEIIDMENFYATATLEEAFAYFKCQASICMDTIKESVGRILTAAKAIEKHFDAGMGRFFTRNYGIAASLRKDLTPATIWLNTEKPDARTLSILKDLDDRIGMEEVLCEALEILNK
jgi:hypothetical protein